MMGEKRYGEAYRICVMALGMSQNFGSIAKANIQWPPLFEEI
jgi:hypothetical protein